MSRVRNRVRQVKNFLLNKDSISVTDFSFCLVPVLLCVAPTICICFLPSYLMVLELIIFELNLNE